MADENIKQVMQDAILDADSLEQFINGSDGETVLTRLSAEYPTLQKAIKQMFENGGLPATPFETKVLMEASALPEGDYALVTDDTNSSNNGLYIKDSNAWKKSAAFDQFSSLTDAVNLIETMVYSYIEPSYNLLDLSKVVGGVISTNGQEGASSAGYSYTDYISVAPNAVYSIINGKEGVYADAGVYHVVYYNKSKEFISRASIITSESLPDNITIDDQNIGRVLLTIPSGVHYIRFNIRANGNTYVYKGEDLRDYVPFGLDMSSGIWNSALSKAYNSVEESILDKSYNLVDVNTFTHGVSIKVSEQTGEPTPSDLGYAVSDFIKVNPNSKYTHSAKDSSSTTIAFYDINKQFLYLTPGIEGSTVNTNSKTAYIRLSINQLPTPSKDNNLMFFEGDGGREYVPYSKLVKKELLPEISDGVTKYINPPANLFNVSKVVKDTVITAEGVIQDSELFSTSDFIKVKAGESYAYSYTKDNLNAFLYTATYDADKNFIERISTYGGANSEAAVFVFDEGVEYIRVSMNAGAPDEHDRMINVGESRGDFLLGYESTLDGVALGEKPYNSVINKIKDNLLSKPQVDSSFSGTFSSNRDSSYFSQFSDWRTRSTAEVISAYEELRLSNPDYITREALGQDLDGNTIYLYKFTPETPTNPKNTVSLKRPRVFLNLGVHGYERLSTLTTLMMMQNITSNWVDDPLLEAARFNVEFLVIPIANVYGYDNSSRANKNGVDINKNMPTGWVKSTVGSSTYGGESPLSELEAVYINSVLQTKPDVVIDAHTFTGTENEFIWVSVVEDSAGDLSKIFGRKLIGRMSHKFAKDLEFLSDTFIDYIGYVSSSNVSTIRTHATATGSAIAATLEISREWTGAESQAPSFGEVHLKTAYEVIVNAMVISVDMVSSSSLAI